ncbi:lipopolysaccharide biosynthesis protein [Sphingosinicella sp. LHD-64]|uniref:lipopolysaccharide biosynthesis protein n=1 Tax=Sphingosinicella sp. LHD-64 TaxID=3072139 RepID=UPI00280FC163|nr:lipopolysaccharide biosynthesis protein [Sphingosinicella sp. LHD-64]MDQ8756690.1 lipopolysaccharide biosynthesis protein [Sphingosinicella sp. LHD-64]
MADSEETRKRGLAERVTGAVIWRSGSQIAAQIVMWTATIIVVRLLEPQDYGLFAMTQVVLVIFNFLNGYSFASSLIQADSVDERRIAQVFGLLILLNVGLAALQFLTAPLAAAYFRQPIIADMLRVQTLLYLATPFIALPSALLARGLDFKNQAKANMAAAVAGAATALGCAYSGFGLWTLVVTPIVMFGVRAIGLTLAARLLVWPSFDFRGAGHVLTFGGALMLCQLFWIVQSQADIFIAGRMLSAHELGLYAEALFLTQIFTSKFIPPLNEVAFPAYAELGKRDGVIRDAFATSVRMTMFVACPLYLGMAATAGPLVATLFGPKWLEMIPLVAMLAIAMPFFAMQIIFSPATNALGRPGIYVRTSLVNAIVMTSAFAIGAQYGVRGLTYAWLVGAPLMLLSTIALSRRAIGTSWSAVADAVWPSACAAALMAVAVHQLGARLDGLPPPAQLALLVPLGGALYLGLHWLFDRRSIADLYRMVVTRRLPSAA